jgi:hypothetical protein
MMKKQIMPPTGLKVGQVLYRVYCAVRVSDKVVCDIEEWVCRTHRAKRGSKSRWGQAKFANIFISPTKYFNLTNRILGTTWSYNKKGQGFWLAASNKHDLQISDQAERLPEGYYTTINKAYQHAIEVATDRVASWSEDLKEALESNDQEWIDQETEMVRDVTRELRVLKSRYKKYKISEQNKKA